MIVLKHNERVLFKRHTFFSFYYLDKNLNFWEKSVLIDYPDIRYPDGKSWQGV